MPSACGHKQFHMGWILEIKAESVPEYKDLLISSGNSILVEAVPGELFWGSGLNKQLTVTTIAKYWPGQNSLGELRMDLRSLLHWK